MVQHVMELNQQVRCVSHRLYFCCSLSRCSLNLHAEPQPEDVCLIVGHIAHSALLALLARAPPSCGAAGIRDCVRAQLLDHGQKTGVSVRI